MVLTLAIPDDLARRLAVDGADVARRVLESFAAEEVRAGRMSDPELRLLLGFDTHFEADAFLKERAVYIDYDASDLEQDRRDLNLAGV